MLLIEEGKLRKDSEYRIPKVTKKFALRRK
jgi:hypothetical protein